MDDIVKDFLVESHENLDQLDRDLVALEQDPTSHALLSSIFRTIHTIKGTCGFLSFSKLESVAHVGENLLSSLRDGHLILNAEITSALLAMVDAIRQMLACIEETAQDGENDYPELIATLAQLQGSPSAAGDEDLTITEFPIVPDESVLLAQIEEPNPRRKKRSRKTRNTATTTDVALIPTPLHVSADGMADAEESIPPADRLGEILVEHGAVHPDEVVEALEQQTSGDPRKIGEVLVEKGAATPQDVAEAVKVQTEKRSTTPTQSDTRASAADSTIRVDVDLLDRLMNLVGELVLTRNQVLQFTMSQKDTAFVATSQRLNLITSELQEGVMKTRMQPIGNVWSKFPRVVRDLALSCHKQVRVEMDGKETELDKTIIEAIKDPLTHMVRNSVDHGIEPPEQRLAVGKPTEGVLSLKAYHESGQVNIEISDDGAGIRFERVKQKAIERGLISAEQAARMGDREAAGLIFLPGFSTAEQVTSISGRGVGMDVVKTSIEKIGGTVDLQSAVGVGSTFKIKIPLTLAIIPALTVTSGGDRYAIPQVSLLELVRLEGEEANTRIEMIQGAPVYRLRGHLLPIVYLNRELQLTAQDCSSDAAADVTDGALNIVVLQAGDRQFGLVVDRINDTQEIVVKPLSKQLKGLSVFAGATIMGDGRVALILDVLGIAQRASVISEVHDRTVSDTRLSMQDHNGDKQTLLLFSLGESGRMAIPLWQAARLEEFPLEKIEFTESQEVVQYRGEIMPLLRLSSVFGAVPTTDRPRVQVVVYREHGRTVGLVVDRILDIVHETVTVQRRTQRGGLLGSAIIHGQVTDLLDVPGVIHSLDPSFFEQQEAA